MFLNFCFWVTGFGYHCFHFWHCKGIKSIPYFRFPEFVLLLWKKKVSDILSFVDFIRLNADSVTFIFGKPHMWIISIPSNFTPIKFTNGYYYLRFTVPSCGWLPENISLDNQNRQRNKGLLITSISLTHSMIHLQANDYLKEKYCYSPTWFFYEEWSIIVWGRNVSYWFKISAPCSCPLQIRYFMTSSLLAW